MKTFLIKILKAILYVVILYAIINFVGGFSDKQSLVLALLLYVAYSRTVPTKDRKFVPFSVFVEPNLYNILQDFDLVTPTEEGWAEIRAGIEKLPKDHWTVWNNRGFSFCFITPELIFNKDWSAFSTEEVDLHASLKPAVIVRKEEVRLSVFGDYSPYLNLMSGREYGCILKLTLLDWYWEKIKTKEILKVIPANDVSIDHMCGTVDIIIARIPAAEFDVHRWSLEIGSQEAYNHAVKMRTETRRRFGWKGKSSSDMYGNETGEDRSDTAEHRYCTVAHSVL